MARGFSQAPVFRLTVDGEDIGRIFDEYRKTLDIQNNAQDSLRAMLTHQTTAAGAVIPQTPRSGRRRSVASPSCASRGSQCSGL